MISGGRKLANLAAWAAAAVLLLSGGPLVAQSTGSHPRSIHEVRKETLLYGIDSQILDLLKTMTQEKDSSLNGEVEQILRQTPNPDLRKAALDFLATVKDWNATETARKFLTDRIQSGDTGGDSVVISAIRYLAAAKDTSVLPLLTQLVQDQSRAVALDAIDAIGKIGSEKQGASLLSDLKDPNFPAELKPQLILALGELKDKAAVSDLTSILKNQNQNETMRRYACSALGAIGDPASVPAIKAAFSDSNTYLRATVVSALAGFPGKEIDSFLTQALKDSFWRVRVNAAESLGKRKVTAAVPILEYKARYDPETVVQTAALKALGSIGNPEAFTFLRSVFSNSLVNPALRTVAVQELVSKDLDASLPEVDKFVQSEWNKPHSRLLDFVCKQLSEAKSPKLEPLFERFLTSPSLNIQIYGLRGIRNNDFKDLLKKVKSFDTPKTNASVRAAAESAMNKLE